MCFNNLKSQISIIVKNNKKVHHSLTDILKLSYIIIIYIKVTVCNYSIHQNVLYLKVLLKLSVAQTHLPAWQQCKHNLF